MQVRLAHKGIIIVLVPLSLGVVFTAFLYLALERAEHETDMEARAREASQVSGQIVKNLFDAAQSLGSYALTKNPMMGQRYSQLRDQTPENYRTLRTLMGDHPDTLEALAKVEALQSRAIKLMDITKSEVDEDHFDVIHLRHLRDQFQATLEESMKQAQVVNESIKKTRQATKHSVRSARLNVRIVLVIGLVSNTLVSMWVALYFSHHIVDRLYVTIENARRLTRREPLPPPVKGTDEIAELDRTFHWMADVLEDAAGKARAMVDNAAAVICSIGRDYKFISVSRAAEKVWGHEPEQLTGQPASSIIHSADSEAVMKGLQQAIKDNTDASFETRVMRKSGELMDVAWSVFFSPLDEAFFCVAHDVTQRKQTEQLLQQSEQRLRTIMENAPVGMLVLNSTMEIEFANHTMRELIQHTTQELAGHHLSMICPQLTHGGHSGLAAHMGKVTETNFCKASGEVFPCEVSLTEFSLGDERKFVAAVLDVTERQEIERAKREFVAMVSHDLRTPLTSISFSISLLQTGKYGELSGKGPDVLVRMEKEIVRLIHLINDLLDLEKMRAGRFDLNIQETSFDEIVMSSIDAVRRIAELRGIQLVFSRSSLRVSCDGARIIQVMVNLLSNSIKFSPTDATVTVTVESAKQGAAVEVAVIDQGRGVPPELVTAIFEKFKQVRKEDASHHQGTGLGLPICKAIVEQHGGKIYVESEPEKGSRFVFTLPAAVNSIDERSGDERSAEERRR